MMAERYLRVQAVAELFEVSKATIYRAISSGRLDALRISGAVRVPSEALRAFVNECGEYAYRAYVVGGVSPETDDQTPRSEAERAAIEAGESAALSDAAADGRACVVCGSDFTDTVSVPLGHCAESGSQVFACSTHPAQLAAHIAWYGLGVTA
ncbi:MAG: helix-turn-helix domain-containing protein [Pseudonocardia sp.]